MPLMLFYGNENLSHGVNNLDHPLWHCTLVALIMPMTLPMLMMYVLWMNHWADIVCFVRCGRVTKHPETCFVFVCVRVSNVDTTILSMLILTVL
jgi:hypothetical protein